MSVTVSLIFISQVLCVIDVVYSQLRALLMDICPRYVHCLLLTTFTDSCRGLQE